MKITKRAASLPVFAVAILLSACAGQSNKAEAPVNDPFETAATGQASPAPAEADANATTVADASDTATADTALASADATDTSLLGAAPEAPAETASVDTGESAAPAPAVVAYAPEVAACGPAGTVALDTAPTETASGSLFAAAEAGPVDSGNRIAVTDKWRNGFLRFGNVDAPVSKRPRKVARRTSLKLASLTGQWQLADGTPGCSCKVTLNAGGGVDTHPASAAGCSASNMDRLINWRLRGSEIVLLGENRTVLATLYSVDKKDQFTGGLTNGTRALLWR